MLLLWLLNFRRKAFAILPNVKYPFIHNFIIMDIIGIVSGITAFICLFPLFIYLLARGPFQFLMPIYWITLTLPYKLKYKGCQALKLGLLPTHQKVLEV